jgi:hypothetical protein
MNLFVSRVSVRKDLDDIPEMFIVEVYSNGTIDGFPVGFSMEVQIPFNDSLPFSEIASLAVAKARAFIAQ